MTEFDEHFIKNLHKLRKTKPAEDYYPEKDWGWYLVGAFVAAVGLAYLGVWLADKLVVV